MINSYLNVAEEYDDDGGDFCGENFFTVRGCGKKEMMSRAGGWKTGVGNKSWFVEGAQEFFYPVIKSMLIK